MSKTLVVLSEGGSVTKIGASLVDGKKFTIKSITEADGLVTVTMLADDGEMIELAVTQKTGEEYWKEIKTAVDGFVEAAGGKLSLLASEISSDAQKIGEAIGQLNLTKRFKDTVSGVSGFFGKKEK